MPEQELGWFIAQLNENPWIAYAGAVIYLAKLTQVFLPSKIRDNATYNVIMKGLNLVAHNVLRAKNADDR